MKVPKFNQTITMLLAFLNLCSCCPIPNGCNLPNIAQYALQSRDQEFLELTVNITITQGHAFMPQAFEPTLKSENMNIRKSTPNGCESIFNITSQDAGIDTPCPWRYQCDYNPQRIPALIFSARCDSATPQGSTSEEEVCSEVHYPITYIMTSSCDPIEQSMSNEWSLGTIFVPVACNLKDINAMF